MAQTAQRSLRGRVSAPQLHKAMDFPAAFECAKIRKRDISRRNRPHVRDVPKVTGTWCVTYKVRRGTFLLGAPSLPKVPPTGCTAWQVCVLHGGSRGASPLGTAVFRRALFSTHQTRGLGSAGRQRETRGVRGKLPGGRRSGAARTEVRPPPGQHWPPCRARPAPIPLERPAGRGPRVRSKQHPAPRLRWINYSRTQTAPHVLGRSFSKGLSKKNQTA